MCIFAYGRPVLRQCPSRVRVGGVGCRPDAIAATSPPCATDAAMASRMAPRDAIDARGILVMARVLLTPTTRRRRDPPHEEYSKTLGAPHDCQELLLADLAVLVAVELLG